MKGDVWSLSRPAPAVRQPLLMHNLLGRELTGYHGRYGSHDNRISEKELNAEWHIEQSQSEASTLDASPPATAIRPVGSLREDIA